jgi:hypothetical protein
VPHILSISALDEDTEVAEEPEDPTGAPDADGDEAASERPHADGPVPLWQQFRRPGRRPTPPTEHSAAAPAPHDDTPAISPLVAPDPDADQASAGVPLWQQFAKSPEGEGSKDAQEAPTAPEQADAVAEPPAHDVQAARPPEDPDALADLEERVLGPAAQHRDWFVQELFHGDTNAYTETLRTLTGSESWTEAARTIAAEVFRRHRIDIYSPAAVAFTDAVEASFRSEP